MSEDGDQKSEAGEDKGAIDIPEAPKLDAVTPADRGSVPLPFAPKLERVSHIRHDAPSNNTRQAAKSGMASTIGTSLVAPIFVFALLGYWLDNHFHHAFPYLTLIGFALGVLGSAANLMNIVKKLK